MSDFTSKRFPDGWTPRSDGSVALANIHGDADATVHYSDEPCAETGHVGWCWWAAGNMGSCTTQAEAEERAVESLIKRGYV